MEPRPAPRVRVRTALRSLLVLACVVAALPAAGCASRFEDAPREQIVMVDEDGELVDPVESSTILPGAFRSFRRIGDEAAPAAAEEGTGSRSAHEAYFDRVLAAMEKGAPRDPVTGRRKVLVFIHGGLNTPADSVDRATRVARAMADERATGEAVAWPIFVNWRSSGLPAWREHVTQVRQGDKKDLLPFWGLLTPFYVAADLARGLGRAPIVFAGQMRNLVAEVNTPDQELVARKRAQLLDRRFDVRVGETGANPWVGGTEGVLVNLLSLPSAVLLDGAGTGTWDNLQRRTMMLFHRERDFERPGLGGSTGDGHGSGALARFMHRLEREIGGERKEEWDLTLIGHSMGTFIVNEILWEFPDLPVRTVVYMAAACPLRDYHESVVTWMREPAHRDARMFHLVLHDTAERAEQFSVGPVPVPLVPRGSLLVWIDNFLAKPATLLDRTAGRFENLMSAEHLTEEWPAPEADSLRNRIVITQFDHGGDAEERGPVRHGGFDQFPFWREAFWRGDPSVRRPESLKR